MQVQPLSPLSARDAEALLGALQLDEHNGTLVPAIARRARGVPLFLSSYAEALRGHEHADLPDLEMPWTLTQVICQRVMAVPETVRELLAVAAVIGRVVSPALLRRATGLEEDTVIAGLEAATAARLLDEDDDAAYHFHHDLIRETIESDLSAARRQLLHRRVGETLEQQERTSVESLAFHFARSDDSAKALRYLELAGDAERRFAHAAAIDFYREVVARLEKLDRGAEAAAIRERLGAALFMSARYDETVEALEQARAVFEETGDEEGMRRVAGRIAVAQFRRGRGDDTIDQVAALAEEGDVYERSSPGGLALRQGLFRLLFARGAYRQML